MCQTLEKVADNCVVHLTPDMIQFGVAPEGKGSAMHVCADVNQVRDPVTATLRLARPSLDAVFARTRASQQTLFFEYNVQSKAENNRISFFVKIEYLSRAVKSCCAAATEHIQARRTTPPATA